MSGEFVISPRDPFSSQPISFHRTQAEASKANVDNMEQQQEGRSLLGPIDAVADEKQSAQSSPAPKFSIRATLDKARGKLSPSGKNEMELAGSEEEFEKQKLKDIEMKKGLEEYEKFRLMTKGNFMGGMQMNG